ncbi:hypothetical protein FDG2_3255 [Candidatus Protofrankia californiensis]|uniref:Uncharacterized protein n=2 Tax=Protofrankia TaxID=2994361 RepID=A0A1C3NZ85_9ACTN|nr:hypothetical protein FDG2_3255 [Candidatus Protofrankia californiensis]
MDSSNSSVPPSQEPVGAKARRKAAVSQRMRSADRKPGGQPGHTGAGLTPAPEGKRVEKDADPPARCVSCEADLSASPSAGRGWAQVWDLAPVVVEKTHWWLPRRRCGSGQVATSRAGASDSSATKNGTGYTL